MLFLRDVCSCFRLALCYYCCSCWSSCCYCCSIGLCCSLYSCHVCVVTHSAPDDHVALAVLVAAIAVAVVAVALGVVLVIPEADVFVGGDSRRCGCITSFCVVVRLLTARECVGWWGVCCFVVGYSFPLLRDFRAETRLTVYSPVYIRMQIGSLVSCLG